MSKIIKHIPVLLLWIAGLAFCSHLVVPHDHCLSDSCSDQEDTCIPAKGESGHHPADHLLCHALNGVAAEKVMVFNLTQPVQNSDISLLGLEHLYSVNLQSSDIRFDEFREPLPDWRLLCYSPMRAPPSLI